MHHNLLTTDPIHITYRLAGSIPAAKLTKLKTNYEAAKGDLETRFPLKMRQPDSSKYRLFRAAAEKIEEAHYQQYEELVHQRDLGPMFLADLKAKQIIIDSWQFIAQTLNVSLYVICVMSNHVHLILRGNEEACTIDLENLMLSHKKFTATQINKLHIAKGRRVWAEDFFDRDVRKGTFTTVFWYILKNPVAAGILKNPFEFSGTWFDPRLEQEYIKPYGHQWDDASL